MAACTLTIERFRAMNADVTVSLALEPSSAEAAFREVRSWFAYAEKVFSRFRPDSELSGLNLSAGLPVRISRTMEEVLELAARYRELTNGLFNPCILPFLISAGYTASFERLRVSDILSGGGAPAPSVAASVAAAGWRLFPPIQTVRLNPGTQIDLGGIVKGWSVDRVANWLIGKGIPAGLVNAGGDLRVWGGTDAPRWEIEIEDPRRPGTALGVVALRSGAVATSGVLRRSWNTREGRRHHLIDPRTGSPADSDVLQCTVSGVDAAEAEIAAKTVCLLGSGEGAEWLGRACPGSDAFILLRNGSIRLLRSPSADAGRKWKGE
ncbi:FAD:protein FMN transferase [Cohnella sp. CFH 77786]|uniref:FAD:protein FMN transferase n=1 Tax=Cohnella sp. CFH 77786 TaxID=2662265 RepID=UPI001C6109D4|nr:FAD:protein FMN transferase [Cohnella sp. CFH 77786]